VPGASYWLRLVESALGPAGHDRGSSP
jgi:hypothetical protein